MSGHVRLLPSSALSPSALRRLRGLMDAAFHGDFSDQDWAHALGGVHALIGADDDVVAHACVVPRVMAVGAAAYRAGYVEAVAVAPEKQGTGLGTAVMTAIADLIRERFELGVLSTGEWHFYERLGWERWRGPSFVRLADGTLERTPEDDDGLMVLRCAGSRDLDLAATIACDERCGESW